MLLTVDIHLTRTTTSQRLNEDNTSFKEYFLIPPIRRFLKPSSASFTSFKSCLTLLPFLRPDQFHVRRGRADSRARSTVPSLSRRIVRPSVSSPKSSS